MHIEEFNVLTVVDPIVHPFHLVVHFGADGPERHREIKLRKNFRKCASDSNFLGFFIIFATYLYDLFHMIYIIMMYNICWCRI